MSLNSEELQQNAGVESKNFDTNTCPINIRIYKPSLDLDQLKCA